MRKTFLALCGAIGFAWAAPAQAQTALQIGGESEFRAIYEEMVEIDSSPTTGSCTRVAEAVSARLLGAGFSGEDVRVIIPDGRPDDGNVVATLRGSNARAGALLLLAHIDVVDARREDWERDPFTLIEENGYFYGRGAIDDKAMAAIFVDMFIRFRAENFRPRRTIKLALTCGEETSDRVNGVEYLLANHRDLIQAEFAINEGAGGILNAAGEPVALNIQAGEKIHQVYALEVTNPGGHSSRPVAENAIYRLSRGLDRLSAYAFPVELTAATRAFFQRMGPIVGGETGAAMAALARDPSNASAAAILARDPSYNAIMRTTCVATQLEAGHAPNALPQRARAILSCRILQGHSAEEVQGVIAAAVADEQIAVQIVRRREGSNAPPLSPRILNVIERRAAQLWPNTPLVPIMIAGATDGRFLNSAGIATYGVSGIFGVPGENNAHGLNERVRVQSVMQGRVFLDGIVLDYSQMR
ncbi:MAG: M20/M25/M40 family metallo-hydrolase [Hyphomonadaceae bacterium]